MLSSGNPKKLCIVVLNWNNASDTIECLNSVYPAVKRGLASIIVCDNASNDNSVEELVGWAKVWFPNDIVERGIGQSTTQQSWDFLLLKASANNGYASGNNLGIRYANGTDLFSYVLILNNDTVIDHDAIDELLKFADSHPCYGVIGSTIMDYYNRELVECAGGCSYNPFTTVFKNLCEGTSLSTLMECNKTLNLDYVSGAATLIRTEVFHEYGYFEEDYFLYYEELDFARKIKQSKYKLAWCKRSIVYHKGASSSGGKNGKSKEALFLCNYHENLSTLIFTRKHHAQYFYISAVLRFFGKSMKYLLSRNLFLFPALTSAYANYFSNNYQSNDAKSGSAEFVVYFGITPTSCE